MLVCIHVRHYQLLVYTHLLRENIREQAWSNQYYYLFNTTTLVFHLLNPANHQLAYEQLAGTHLFSNDFHHDLTHVPIHAFFERKRTK